MTEKELWNEYCHQFRIDENTPHGALCFGADSDALARLVCEGEKTATCSLFDLYERLPDIAMPREGDLNIILNGSNAALCIIRIVKVYVARFCDVSPEHAYREGEGDRSLAYWRKVHTSFFTKIAQEYGVRFEEESKVICIEFELVYKH